MDLNTERMLDISTGHLSTVTRSWLSAAAAANTPISVAEREEGWFVNTTWGDTAQHGVAIPPDLLHILAVCHAHDVSYVMFDTDGLEQEGLPFYDDRDAPDCLTTMFDGIPDLVEAEIAHPVTGMSLGRVLAVRPGAVDYLALAGKVATVTSEDPAP